MNSINPFGSKPLWLALVCLITLAGSSFAADVVINAKPEAPRADSWVYKVETPRAGEAEVVRRCSNILEKSGYKAISRDMMKPVEDRLAMYGKEIEVSMNKNGTEFFYSNFPALKLTGKTGRLRTDEEAVKLSHAYLRKTGLMPRNEGELKVGHVGGIMQMLSNARAPEKKAQVVYFYRELDGLKVRNFGSSITVTLAESDIPAGVQYHWREVASREKVASRSFLSADRINSLIREDVNRVFAKDAKVIIDKIELVLYDNGGNYIQPAYCYQGISKGGGKGVVDMPVLGYVQAMEKTYEPIHHPAFSPDMKKPVLRRLKPRHDKDE